MISVPGLAVGDDVTADWFNLVAGAVAEMQSLLAVTAGPTALSFGVNWENYSGGYVQCQVYRFGPLVAMCGLIRVKAGSTGQTPGATQAIANVPVGFRPRATGASSPLGGKVNTIQVSSAAAWARIDVEPDGDVVLVATTGGVVVPTNGWVSLHGWWITE